MAADFPVITLNCTTQGDGSFIVSGVYWLTAPANAIVPRPSFVSAVPGISASELAALRAGTVVEQPFTSGAYPSGTSQATVDADLVNATPPLPAYGFTVAQNSLNSANPALSTAVGRAYNGSTWGAYPGSVGALAIGARPQIVTELYQAIALGLLPNIVQGRAQGYVVAASAALTRIRATAFSPLATGAQAQISVSSSSSSDAPAGTGALTVTVNYWTLAWVLKSATFTLNGTTPVNSVATDFAYFESAQVATTGSNLANVGVISFFKSTGGTGGTWASIAIGDNATFYAHHYVPAGKTCLVINCSGGARLTAGALSISRLGDPSQSNLPILSIGGQFPHLAGGNEDHIFQVPIVVPGPDLILMSDFPNAATASNVAFGNFEYLQL